MPVQASSTGIFIMTPDKLKYIAAGLSWLAVLGAPSSVAGSEIRAKAEAGPAATSEQIAGWIAELDDNRYLVREQATRQLLDAGTAALDPLLVAANAGRPEPADRAVWIMRRQARSSDNELAIAALERIVQLKDRPLLVEKADLELAERSVVACQQRLAPLGAELVMEPAQVDLVKVVPLLHVRLTDKWQGTAEDLRCLAQLKRQIHYRLQGEAIDDAVVKFFEEKEKLEFLQLFDTKVTPAGVDGLKARHPDAVVYMRGEALLGVQAENHPTGVMVLRVEPGTAAAAAGILPGDVIATIDGHALPDFDRLTARIAQHHAGDTIEIETVRGEERKKIPVKLGSWTGQQ
jgi:hypothetical protein